MYRLFSSCHEMYVPKCKQRTYLVRFLIYVHTFQRSLAFSFLTPSTSTANQTTRRLLPPEEQLCGSPVHEWGDGVCDLQLNTQEVRKHMNRLRTYIRTCWNVSTYVGHHQPSTGHKQRNYLVCNPCAAVIKHTLAGTLALG